MDKKRIWLVIPTTLLPYLALFTLTAIFLSTKYRFFEVVMESVFNNNAIYLILALLLYCILATALSIIFFATSIRQEWEPVSLAKSAMIIKLIQVPAYALIFVLGILLVITIFTIPFSIGLFLLDCLCLFLSGLLTSAAVINAARQGIFSFKEVVWIIILQLVFCADVIASILFYLKVKERKKRYL